MYAGLSVRFNRQLHPEEKTLAKQLAEKSKGKYTQAQIEDQMRIMGVSTFANGHESGAPDTLVGQTPTDSEAKWMYAGSTADGKPILTQVTAQANPELQQYIVANANTATSAQLPTQFNYDRPSSNSWGFNVTGPFTKFDKSDVNYVRNTTLDTASMVSTNAGRFSSTAAAIAEIPSPYSPGLSTAAFISTVVGIAADAIGQLAKPDGAQYVFNGFAAIISNYASSKWPMYTPAINEVANKVNESGVAKSIQNRTKDVLGIGNSSEK